MSTATTPGSASALSQSTAGRLVRHGEGEVHPVMGDPMRFIVTAADTGGAYALAEQTVRPGNGAPPHIHHNEDETFYILDGEFEAVVNGTLHRLGQGDFVHAPRGAVRSFRNAGPRDGRLLIHHCPGSASAFYIAMGKLPFPPKIEDIMSLGQRHGIEVVLPKKA